MKSLNEMASEVFDWATTKGWNDEDRTFGDEIALIHSEASEALEAYRDIKFTERTGPLKHALSCVSIVSPQIKCECVGKPDDVASEFADILIRLLHYSVTHGFDLEAEYERKMAYNRIRPWRHGGRNL